MTAVDPTVFRRSMARFASGVAIVTTELGGELHGMTVNAVTSVSLEPSLLLVCLTRESRTAQVILERRRFNLHVLSSTGEELCRTFARPGADHYADVEYSLDDAGIPVLPHALVHFACTVHDVTDGGDHVVVVGLVVDTAEAEGAPDPLIFWRSTFRELAREQHTRPFSFWEVAEWGDHAGLSW